MKKEVILMVHNFYQIGGGEHTVFENELRLLRENGHKVLTYTRSNDELKASKKKLILSPFTTVWSFKTFRDIKKIIKDEKIDIIHCHNTFPLISPSVYYAAWSMKIPVVQTIHNFRLLCPAGTFYHSEEVCEKCKNSTLIHAVLNKCYRDSIVGTLTVTIMLAVHRLMGTYKKLYYIFLTEFSKSKYVSKLSLSNMHIFIKPNFEFDKNSLFCLKEPKNKKYIFVGRLDGNKGVKFLIELWKKNDLGTLYILGDGNLRQYVEENADGKKIRYLGFCKKELLTDKISTAEAMLFPSEGYEGYPMTIIESFSRGTPVLAADLGNQGNIIQNGVNGYKYRPKDEESFIKGLACIHNEGMSLRQSTLSYYHKNLNDSRNYELLVDIYTSVKENFLREKG